MTTSEAVGEQVGAGGYTRSFLFRSNRDAGLVGQCLGWFIGEWMRVEGNHVRVEQHGVDADALKCRVGLHPLVVPHVACIRRHAPREGRCP